MVLNRRVTLVLLQFFFLIFCESKTLKRKDTHLMALMGYLHGYKIGYDYAFQLPPIVPVIVIPIINQRQSVNILKSQHDDKLSENVDNVQTDKPSKLALLNSTDTDSKLEIVEQLQKDVSLKLKRKENVIQESEDTLRQAVNLNKTVDEITTTEIAIVQVQNATVVPTQLNITVLASNATLSNTTEIPLKGYPTAMYNNEFVTSIQLTTGTDEATELPSVDDNRWQNFTNINNSTQVSDKQSNATADRGGPYSAAIYHNNVINNLELTTKLYETDAYLPPVQDERWKNFSADTYYENAGQFKPLAGLYYDGFLHRPLKKVGFIPRPNHIF